MVKPGIIILRKEESESKIGRRGGERKIRDFITRENLS